MRAMSPRSVTVALGVQVMFATGCRVTALFVCERDE
jgi:hypothetical protein